MSVLPKMKTIMIIPARREIEIDNVDGYYVGKVLVVMSLLNTFRVNPAPVEKAASIYVVFITICSG